MTEIYPQLKMYRQGDVLLRQIPQLPNYVRKRKDKRIAEGEIADHAHVILNGAVYEVHDQSDELYVKADDITTIAHEEHNSIKLEKGVYEVIRQQEYLGKGIKYVCCH